MSMGKVTIDQRAWASLWAVNAWEIVQLEYIRIYIWAVNTWEFVFEFWSFDLMNNYNIFELSAPEKSFMILLLFNLMYKRYSPEKGLVLLLICQTKILIYGSTPEKVWVCCPRGAPCETFWRARGWSRWAWDTCPRTWGARMHIHVNKNQNKTLLRNQN